MTDNPTADNEVRIERVFDAPVDLIWEMWTVPEHFKNWYGPDGFRVPVAEMDVRVGGKLLICMERGSMTFWTTGVYKEVIPNKRLVYTDSPADENGNVVEQKNRPAETVVTVQLEAIDGQTKMVITHVGIPGAQEGANVGWNQAMDKLATYAQGQ